MIYPVRYVAFCLLLFTAFTSSLNAKLARSLLHSSHQDQVVKVWVFFTDKPSGARVSFPAKTLARRKRVGFTTDIDDLPVSSDYINKIKETGATLHQVFKWENAASFFVHGSVLQKIASYNFVKDVAPVGFYKKRVAAFSGQARRALDRDSIYGSAFTQLNLISVPEAHDYLLRFRKVEAPGAGVLLAFFDTGFRLTHNCFAFARNKGSVKAVWDFIDNDTIVFDPDSVRGDLRAPYFGNDEHGSQVLSLVAGYDPGSFVGTAWGADFVLARTEDTYFDGTEERESHIEEDNWAAAAVWAESLGVDIISSSLGYRDWFTDTVWIVQGNDTIPVKDYPYSFLDGKTTIVSRAAQVAIERGIIVVNAAGNEGSGEPGTLVAPADVEGVITVGAVNSSGNITYFSSTGPTADGRYKPDLVALGTGVIVPSVNYNDLSYNSLGNGTSFSTPMIAGLCALVSQSHKSFTAEQIRTRIYEFCTLQQGQDSVDNYYGRGIPDALLSCMNDDEVYLSVTDSSGLAVQNAIIANEHGDSLGITDLDGIALFSIPPDGLPGHLTVGLSGQKQDLLIEETPARKSLKLSVSSGLVILLRNSDGGEIDSGTVFFKIAGSEQFYSRKSDSHGSAYVTMYREETVRIYAKAPGYQVSDTLTASICTDLCTLRVVMNQIRVSHFLLYPTVLRLHKNNTLNVEFLSGSEMNRDLLIKSYIRSVDGVLVWKESRYVEPNEPFRLRVPMQKLSKLSPGLYFFIIEYNGRAIRKKFIIAG